MSELLIITIGYGISILLEAGFGLFVFSRNPKSAAHITFLLMCLSLAGYQLSFALGVNAPDAAAAYYYWFFNLIDVAIAIFYFHFIVLALEALPRWRVVVYGVYIVGLSIFAAALVFPTQFVPSVSPKLYLSYYLDGGPIYIAMLAFFLISFVLSFAVMFAERARRAEEGKRRVDYYVFSLLFGILTGPTAFPLVFDIPLDPILSMFLFTFTIPMVYGMLKKDLLEIRLVVRRTLVFTVLIAAIAGGLIGITFLNTWLASVIPGFTYVAFPVVVALASVSAGAIYLRKAREAERLKYEFVTVAAHKFRTPLTRIRWAADILVGRSDIAPDAMEMIERIKESDLELIQLSNLLMDAARMEKEQYTYTTADVSLLPVVEQVLTASRATIKDKGIMLSLALPPVVPFVHGDSERLASAVAVLVENAISYTPTGGSIRIAVSSAPDEVRFEITDSGIGLTGEELKHIFKKFFRTDRARKADTEGVGLGLSMAKSIIERHRGTIGASSPGVGQGSTFWFTLPSR